MASKNSWGEGIFLERLNFEHTFRATQHHGGVYPFHSLSASPFVVRCRRGSLHGRLVLVAIIVQPPIAFLRRRGGGFSAIRSSLVLVLAGVVVATTARVWGRLERSPRDAHVVEPYTTWGSSRDDLYDPSFTCPPLRPCPRRPLCRVERGQQAKAPFSAGAVRRCCTPKVARCTTHRSFQVSAFGRSLELEMWGMTAIRTKAPFSAGAVRQLLHAKSRAVSHRTSNFHTSSPWQATLESGARLLRHPKHCLAPAQFTSCWTPKSLSAYAALDI